MDNTIIRASAGSGKTFQLSNVFLNAVLQVDKAVGVTLDTILASTFTRKAAGEITDRIFTKFADAALDPAKREALGEFLVYPESDDIEKELQDRLALLAQNMYRLRVGTLDSYFNKIATAFSLELGLPPGWTMLDEAEYPRFLNDAVREVFNESKRKDVRNLMYLLQQGEEKAGMTKELVELAEKMLPVIRDTTLEAWVHGTPERLEPHTHGLLSEEKINELLERIVTITNDQLPQTAKKEPLSHYLNAKNNLSEAITSRDWKSFLNNGLVKAVVPTLDDPGITCMYSRKNVRKDAPELFEVVTTLLPHAKSVLIKVLISQTEATYHLLKMVAEKLDGVMERERKFRFDDITRRIADYYFENRLDSLRHRLNAETRHLLLDEFQDTALLQWKILEPLALQTVGDKKGTYFCVGDVKQSIYSWRGGEAAIFDSMKERLEQRLKNVQINEKTMEETRRCAKPIIDTVNTIFQNIQDSATVQRASAEAGSIWRERFKEHSTTNEKPGYCALEESPLEPELTKEESHIKYTVDRIEQLLTIVENRTELKDGIGVLVSTGKFGAKIVSALKERGIETTGRGASLLESPAVQHIVSALVFSEHPGNTIARFHLAHGPLAEVLELEKHDDHSCSRIIRNDLVNRGYGSVIGNYLKVFAPFCDAIEWERLEKLLEVAYRFDDVAKGVRTGQFIDLLEKERVNNQNAAKVQVMTIHSAKGLEFDIVVLPQLDVNLKGRIEKEKHVKRYKINDDHASPLDFVIRYVDEAMQAILPEEYRSVFEYRKQREIEESLCELYVAMTRAVRSLVMIVLQRKDISKSTSFENVLRELLETANSSSENILYEAGDPNWYHGIPGSILESVTRHYDELECKLNKTKVLHHVPRITPSSMCHEYKFEKTAKVQNSLQISDKAALKGIVIHSCFEYGITWLDDPQSDSVLNEDKLRELIEETLEGRAATFDATDVLMEFCKACQTQEIIDALSRSRYLPDREPELERERRFAVWYGDKIMRGTIDRLVVQRDTKGTTTKIEVIDYKTGGTMAEIDSLVEIYRDQLDAYRQAVCELYGVEAGIVDTTLIFVTLGKVVTVPQRITKSKKRAK